MKYLAALVVLILFIGMAMASSEDPDGEGGAGGDSTDVRRLPDGRVEAERDSLAGRWTVEEGTSPLDDSPSVTLSVPGAFMPPGTSTESATLYVYCLENRTRVSVQTPDRFSPPDQPEKMRVYDVPVRLRVDEEPVQEAVWEESSDGTALSAPRPVALAKRLAGRRRLRLEYTPHEAPPRLAVFDVTGLEHHLGAVARTCNWKWP